MTTRFSVGFNAVNLIRNGGLDFLKDTASMPPFWGVEGADFLAVPPANTLSIVSGETPDSEFGAVNYFKILLASSTPAVLSQEFEERFIQMAFAEELGEGPRGLNRYRYEVPGCQLIAGWVSVGLSVRVLRGSVSIAARLFTDSNRQTYEDVGLYQSLSTKEWGRPTIVKDLGMKMLRKIGLVFTSMTPGLSEIHVGAVMMASGKFSDLPYTGDPMADAIPKGAIVFAFGDACPPGFEKMSLTPVPESGRIFFKQGTPSLAVEGDERHNHSGASMTMNPEDDWAILSLVPTSFGSSYGRYADDGSEAHQHTLGLAKHVPPTRDVILCKRL